MPDLVLTGASRGIGRALALELAPRGDRLLLVARDEARLAELARQIEARGGRAVVIVGDLGGLASARRLGSALLERLEPGATLVHGAGLWPKRRELGPEGLEASFAVNCLGPLAMQRPLLEAGGLRRILVVSAGLIAFGRFDAARTPVGDGFSALRTYADTKLALAVAMRDLAARHPEVDVLALHPGIVRTDLVSRGGLLGRLIELGKRGLEAPEKTAARLARILARERWSPPGQARWQWEEEERPWPRPADDERVRAAVREATERLLGE